MRLDSVCKRDLARAILVLVLAADGFASGSSIVGAQVTMAAASPGGEVVSDQPHGPGSLASPIPLSGIETSVPALEPTQLPGRVKVYVGHLGASAFGVPDVVLTEGRGPDWTSDPVWTTESNLVSGGGMDIPIGSLGDLFFAGGEVMLRDPISIAGSVGSGSRYWNTSAGVQIRF